MAGQREYIASAGDHWRVARRAGGPTGLSPQVAQAIVSGCVPSHRRFELCPTVVVLVSSVTASRSFADCRREAHLLQCSCVLPAFATIATRYTATRRARYADQSRSATSAVGFQLLSDGHARDRSSRLLRRTPIANCSNLIIPGPVSLDGCGAVPSA